MLIGKPSKRPNLKTVRRIKQILFNVLQLTEDAVITVTELACLEEDCSPIETVIGLLRPELPQLQYKVHKSVEEIDSNDLLDVCISWGFDVQPSTLEPFLILHHSLRS